MSKERYDRIRKYGGELELTPGSESDVILTLGPRTHEMMKPKNKALAQFELMANYRFHRHVTGASAIEAVNGVVMAGSAGFTSAPGSAGTLAAGDQIKMVFRRRRLLRWNRMNVPRWQMADEGSIGSKVLATRMW